LPDVRKRTGAGVAARSRGQGVQHGGRGSSPTRAVRLSSAQAAGARRFHGRRKAAPQAGHGEGTRECRAGGRRRGLPVGGGAPGDVLRDGFRARGGGAHVAAELGFDRCA
jgi:hypothetical protein